MITIKSKIRPGDKLYTIVQTPIKKQLKCNLCEGNGEITHNNILILCPKCKGQQLFENTKYNCWEVVDEPLIVNSISVKYKNPTDYILSYNISKYKRSVHNVFFTKEEAILKCNELNKAILEKSTKNIHKDSNRTISESKYIIKSKYNIGDNIYTLKKDFKDKKNMFFKPMKEICKIDSIGITIFDDSNYEIRYKIGKMNRQESRVFYTLDEVVEHCKVLNQMEN